MLTIKRNSWHYKLLSDRSTDKVIKKSNDGNLSLCWYFWQVIFGLLAWVSVIALFICIIVAIVFILYSIGYTWYFLIAYGLFDVTSFDNDILGSSMVINIILFISAFIFYFVSNLIDGVKWLNGTLKERPKKEPNIVVEYIKAKKQRVCPVMKIED